MALTVTAKARVDMPSEGMTAEVRLDRGGAAPFVAKKMSVVNNRYRRNDDARFLKPQ
jgi:hypothetical protein